MVTRQPYVMQRTMILRKMFIKNQNRVTIMLDSTTNRSTSLARFTHTSKMSV